MNIDWRIETHDRVSSTQDLLKDMAEQGVPEGVVVHALEQSGGYGRHGRVWVSEPGNLYLSILLRPACDVRAIGQLSLMAGLAVGQAVAGVIDAPDKLRLKWPNDVLVNGQKCAGIILETGLDDNQTLKWVALGIGLNLKSAPQNVGVCLDAYADKNININKVRDSLLSKLEENYDLFVTRGFAPVKAAWLEMAHKPGDKVSVKLGDQLHQGAFEGVDDDGALLFIDEQGARRKITSGDIFL